MKLDRTRAVTGGRRLCLAAIWCALVMCVAPRAEARPAAPTTRQATEDSRPLVLVRALGGVSQAHLRLACRTILERYPVRCEIGRSRSLVDFVGAWNNDREQLDARAALDDLFRTRHAGALVELNLTTVDTYENDKPYVFGLASLTDRVAIVSLARVESHRSRPDAASRTRISKLVLHEVGHAFGLPHHDDPTCVMRQDATASSLDSAPDQLCTACHARLAQQAQELSRPGQLALDRIRGHLVRGGIEPARAVLVHALWEENLDAGLLNKFALAFLETGHWNEAISLLDLSLKSDPEFAEAHVNRGIALQMRAGEGDLRGAIAHFSRALELRPEWGSVRDHLATLRLQNAHAQGPAGASRP